MKLYGGKLIKNKVRQQIDDRQELRNAILWDVDSTNRYCRVKIQGSDTHVKAFYPENWESTPSWLKPGNAVLITHPGGSKGRIEVVGHGILLPTAIAGGTAAPTPSTPGDTVLSGGNLSPCSPNSMGAVVTPGTIRINGVTYTLSGMIMDRADIIMDRFDLIMDLVGDIVSFDAASATEFRYDSVVAGTDGDAHVVKGDEFASTDDIPDPPAAPANHVRLGWVLIYPNMTAVTASDINRLFSAPTPSELTVVVADNDLAWGETSTTITVSVLDQYGNSISHGGVGYQITFAWDYGNGTLSYGGDSQDETASFVFYMTSSAVVTYTRDGNDPGDLSPSFTIEEEGNGLSNATYILLRDAAGDLMF